MSDPTPVTANTPTEPAPVTPPTPDPAPAAPSDGKPNGTPAPSDGTLLGKPADGDPKPADPKPGEPAKPAEPAKPEGAPEKYEFKDADKFDATVMGAFSEAAKEANLTQDAAQKVLDKVAPALQARNEEQVKAVHQQWTETSTADKEFGGEKLKENLGIARKALDQFGTPELKTFLEASGLGNHPEVIRMLFRTGKAMSEDKFVSGAPGGNNTVNPANVLYDKT